MGLNDQAEADTREEGLEDENAASREQDVDATEQNNDQQQGEDFQDVNDIESFQNTVGELDAADELAEEDEGSGESGRDQDGESDGGEQSEAEGDEGQEESGNEAEGDEDGEEDDGGDGEGEGDEADGQEDGDGDGQEESDDGDDKEKAASKRIRLRTSDNPVRARAIELMQRNQDMLPSEAEAKAKAELGIDDQSDESGESGDQNDDGETDGMPKTVEDARAQLADLRKERAKALREDLDFDKFDELDEKISQLNDHISDLRLNEVQSKQVAEKEHLEQFEASKAKAVDLYPFVTSAEGKEIERMEEIDQQLKDAGDPLYSDPDKPLRIAQMVAREFGIAPKGKVVKQPDAATRKDGRPPRKKSPVQPASGNARTAPRNQQGQLDERIEKINDPLAYEEAMAELG